MLRASRSVEDALIQETHRVGRGADSNAQIIGERTRATWPAPTGREVAFRPRQRLRARI
jgi:hypothetical protein